MQNYVNILIPLNDKFETATPPNIFESLWPLNFQKVICFEEEFKYIVVKIQVRCSVIFISTYSVLLT